VDKFRDLQNDKTNNSDKCYGLEGVGIQPIGSKNAGGKGVQD